MDHYVSKTYKIEIRALPPGKYTAYINKREYTSISPRNVGYVTRKSAERALKVAQRKVRKMDQSDIDQWYRDRNAEKFNREITNHERSNT